MKYPIKKNLKEYWQEILKNVSKFERSDYQVFAILTMCRTLYTLETGKFASKSKAAQWAANKLDSNWRIIIEQALVWEPNTNLNKHETFKFIEYVINQTK